ncbi:MAG: M23 family metallopeptidase [Lachnospiraceae bacterium]|nr:M23 family metallopeptidase [Lachnospiraceae bacterium]
MKKRKRRIKKHYTVSVTSDYSSFKTKYYRSRFNIFKVCINSMIIAVLVAAAITAFEFIQIRRIEKDIVTFREIISEQKDMIDELNAQKAELQSQNEVLNATIGIKTVEAQEEERIMEEKHYPNSFPLTGSASYVEQDTEAENYVPIAVFEMSDISDVVSAADGVVTMVREDTNYGTFISIDHGNGYVSIYRNAGEPKVMEGDEVVRGYILFIGGGDGSLLGYQITKDGEYIDPMTIIDING